MTISTITLGLLGIYGTVGAGAGKKGAFFDVESNVVRDDTNLFV